MQCLQPEGFDGEEVAGEQLLLALSHEMAPAEGTLTDRRRQDAVAVEDVANGAGGDREA